MSKKIIQLNEVNLKTELKELVRSSVEETLNGLLEQEAQQQLTQAARYERSEVGRLIVAVTTSEGSPRPQERSRYKCPG